MTTNLRAGGDSTDASGRGGLPPSQSTGPKDTLRDTLVEAYRGVSEPGILFCDEDVADACLAVIEPELSALRDRLERAERGWADTIAEYATRIGLLRLALQEGNNDEANRIADSMADYCKTARATRHAALNPTGEDR